MTAVAVLSAGLSQPSSTRLLAGQLAESVVRKSFPEPVDIIEIELRELAKDITNHLLTGFPSETLRLAIDSVTGADGLIAVTPVFSASSSGLFKSFFDVLGKDALADKPTLIAATGGSPRHSLALDYAVQSREGRRAPRGDWSGAGDVRRPNGEFLSSAVRVQGAGSPRRGVRRPAPAVPRSSF